MFSEKLFAKFRKHYAHLKQVSGQETASKEGIPYRYEIISPDLRPGNGPRIFHHGKKTNHVIILTHGLSDSPRYVEDIGKYFHQAGLNVILPLLHGHGLLNPDDAFQDKKLHTYWRRTIDRAVTLAASLGKVVSIGGFSTGAALSYNRILRDITRGKKVITGGLFLFSAAIELLPWEEFIVKNSPRILFKTIDGAVEGIGPDPYRYPVLPTLGAKELTEIMKENEKLSKDVKLQQPVFAAHFLSDDIADLHAVFELLKTHAIKGSVFVISEALEKVKLPEGTAVDNRIEWGNAAHASLPLQRPIVLEHKLGEVAPNPQFDLMMHAALDFFEGQVGSLGAGYLDLS